MCAGSMSAYLFKQVCLTVILCSLLAWIFAVALVGLMEERHTGGNETPGGEYRWRLEQYPGV